MADKWAIAVFILIFTGIVQSSHFRGGIIQWRPLNAQNFDGRIEVNHRIAWRRSCCNHGCTATDIGTTRLFGGGELTCRSGCSGRVGTLDFYCTNFDTTEDWIAGERTYTYSIGTGVTNFEASYASCCWISLRVGGGPWEIRVKGNLAPRSDNGRINSSPVTTSTPIVRLQFGCTHNIRIPVQDADQDTVRCRWAVGNECSGVCQTVPGATIDQNNCILRWTASHGTGWYGVAIQIEDFITSSSTTPLSSVPLQFLINVFSNSQPCTGGVRPSLVSGETPPDGSCIPVPFGTTYTAGLVAASGGTSASITRFITSSPFGLITSTVTQSQFNSTHYYANVTWTPTASQFGLQQFCFRAVSSNGLESGQSCITLLGGVTGPSALSSSVSPMGRFSPTASTTWSITFNQAITRPSSSRYIRFYEASGRNVYNFDVTSSSASYPASGSGGRILTFTFSASFTAGLSHYVLLDSGVAVGTEFCNQESLSVTSTSFWTFTTGCPTGFMDSGGTCVDINECATGAFTCPTNAVCMNTVGSYLCPCAAGFEASGSSCIDVNECARGTDQCHPAATCTNTIGSYTCTCPTGSVGNGRTCTDLCNECTGTPTGCGRHNCNISTSDCTNTIGSFQCTCRFGVASDGVSCTPPPRPDPPTSVSTSSIGTTSITFVWVAPVATIANRISTYILVLTESGGGVSITQSVSGTSYTFTGLQEYRTYTCVITAVSIYGPVSVATAPLSATTQQAAPSAPPTNFMGQATSSSSATVTWGLPPADEINGIITGYVINVTVVGTGTTFQLTSTTNSLTITTLTPYTTFICIIAAVTSVGIGPFSTQFTLITPQDAPISPPQNVVLSPVSSTSISLSWAPPPASDINGVIVEYRINITEVVTGRVFYLTSSTTSITAQGLHPYYAYECVVSAFTVGIGPYSQIFRITTPEDVPSGSPLNFGGTASTSRSATISWSPPRADLQNGVIIRYIINVTVVETGQSFQLTSTTNSLTVTTLTPYRNFICIIAAVTSVGIGPFSSQFTLTTPQDVPTSAPQTPTAVVRNSRAIFCSWSPPPAADHNGIIVEYRINITEVITGRVFVRVSTTTSLEITSLHPDYVYEWRVTAVTVGAGPYTTVSTIRTPEDVPTGPPQSTSAIALTAQSIQINWQLPSLPDRNGVITDYVIIVTSLETTISQQFTTTATTLTVPNLDAFSNYVCIIAANTAVGRGPFSAVINIQTLETAPGSHPSNFTGFSLNSTYIYLTWDPPPPSQVNGIIREYRLNVTEAATGQLFQFTTDADDRELIVGDLHPYYIYHCTVVAHTILPGPVTSTFTIQTEEDIPTGPPTNFVAGTVDPQTISLSWGPPQMDQQNGILRYYLITLTSNLPTVTRNISASLQSLNITGLRPYTLYSCIIEVSTIGLGPPTTPQLIRTPEAAPSGPPRNLNLTINDSRSLILSWEVPLPQDVNGIITDYTINISSVVGTSIVVVGSNTTTFTVTSLNPFVAYTCIVAAHTSAGRGPFSGGVTLTTPEDIPEAPPVMISHSNTQSRSVDLSWMAPRGDRQNGVIRYYVIEAYENITGNVLTYQTLSAQTSFTVNNLHPYYTYSIRVGAVTTGPGPFSVSYTVLTMQDIPTAAPISPSGAAVPGSASLINLRWSPVPAEHLNGIRLFYLVDVTEVVTNNSWTFHAVQTQINIGPLHAYYTYRCRVAAFTVGVGPYTPFFFVNSGEAYPTGAPANLTAPRATTTSLSLSWDPPRFDQQNGIIRYYTVYIQDVTSGTSSQVTSNTTRVTVQNLQPFFTYNISVAAFTIGEGPVSSSLIVTLPQTAPSVAPTNVRGLAIDHSSISLEWDAPPTLLLNGILTAYIINVTERETGYTFEVNTTSTSVVLDSLHPDYVYECRVAAFTIAPGPFSTIFAVQVLMSAPSAPPDNITATALTSSRILITWDLPPQENRNGPILAYNFTATEAATGLVVNSSILLTRSAVVYALRPFTLYTFSVSARTSVGYGPYGNTTEVTLQDTPSAPTNLNVLTVDGDPYSLYVTWAPPTVPNGYVTSYNVYCQDSQTVLGSGGGPVMMLFPSPTTFTSTVGGDELNATVIGLTPFSNYGCYVSANTSIGEGNDSAPIFQTTDEFIPAGPPTNLQVSVVNATSVSLSWSPPVTPYGNIVSYTVLVEVDSLFSTNTSTIVVGAVMSTTVDELLPNSNYNFSVAASTRIGTGPSDTVTAMTPQGSPYGTPRSVNTMVTGTTTANVSWVPPDPALQNGLITYYSVVLSDLSFGMADRRYNTTLTSFSFTGLEEYGRYGCQVAAGTVGGEGPLSTSVMFTTFEDVPTAPPQNISGTALSSSLIMFFWSPPPPLDVNGAIRYYTVEVVERFTGRQWTFFAIDADLHVGSLHPYYFYDFNVSATTVGMGPFSTMYSVLTLPEPPVAAPEQLSLGSKTSTSLTITWNPPPFEDTNGPIQYYTVRVTEVDTNRTLSPMNTFTRQITLTQLHPYYTYRCTVAAYTVGIGPYTLPITIQLDQEAPTGPPLGVTGSSLNSNSISLSWSPPLPSERNGIIQHYLVNVTETDTGLENGHVSLSTNFTLFALHPYYTYSIRVTAVTVGPGPPASAIAVRTDQDVPSGPAEGLNATVVSSEDVLIAWEDPASEDINGVITGYVINVTVVSTGQSFQVTSTTRSLLLDNLLPFTTYTCRVAARTSVGVGPYSLPISFLTDETAPSSEPENVNVTAISSTSISVSWTPPPLSDRNGIITEYRINVTELNTGSQQLLTSLTTSYVIQSLHPYYMYEVTVSAHTVATGPYSESQIVQTPQDVPSGFPQMLMEVVSAASSQSITFSWTALPEDQQNGQITSYTLNITETGGGVTIQRTVPSSQTSVTITSLQPFTSYSAVIAASTSVGLGPFSTVLSVLTQEDSPAMSPTNLTGSAQDSTTILLDWDHPSGRHNGVIREYRVNITEVETGNVIQRVSVTTDLLVGGLHPDYIYQWIVTAFTVGEGPYSGVYSVRTPEDVPSGPPTNIVSTAPTSSSISLSWDLPLPGERNGVITGYVINITNLDTEVMQQHVTGLVSTLTISDLSPFTVYVTVIAARTAVGIGPFSGVVSAQTLEDAPGSHPLNSTGFALNSTHIFLDWSPPLEADVNGIIREYRINVTEGETNTLRQLTTDNLTTEITVGPLHPFYTYHCTILAFTVEGGPNTTVISIRTGQDVPSGPPTGVTATASSTRSISMSWGPPRRDQQNGIVTHYLVTVLSDAGTITRNVSSVQRTISISGLRPYTVYNCTVQADTVGLGPPAEIIQVSTPQDVPTGPPQAVGALAVDATTLLLSWGPPVFERTNGLVQRYSIILTELETGVIRQFNVTEESFMTSALHPFYQYRYVIAAETVGLGPYSVANLIQLPEAAPSSSPESVQISEVRASSFLLSWSAPAAVNHNGIIRSYTINITEENTGNQLQFTTNSNSQRVESLHPYYNYTCVVSAFTVGDGPFSQPVGITTAESVPTGPPVNFLATVASSTSILLVWDPPPVHVRNGVLTSYTITQVVAGSSSTLTTSDLMLLVTGLVPFTSYSFDIAASTSVGVGPASAPVTALTNPDAPGAPSNIVSSNLTSTSLTLSWQPPRLLNGVITHYVITALEVNTGTNFTYRAQSHVTFSIGDLHPYYTYRFNVSAVTVEVGPASLDHTVTTLQDIPSGPPGSIMGSALDSMTLQISWTPPPVASQNGIITEYVVNVSVMETGQQFQRRTSGSASSLNIASLHPDYTYTYMVAATTAVGRGPFSNFSSTRMPEDVPTSPPLNSTGRAVNSTAIFFSWEHPAPSGRNGIITGYYLTVTELETNVSTTYTQTGARIELVVGSLHPYYQYQCVIAAGTSVGRGPYGEPFITSTLADVPSGVPLNVMASALTSRSIQVTWEPPQMDQQNGVIQSYMVVVMVAETRTSLSLSSSTTSLTIPDLHPAYSHTIQVAAVTVGVGPLSDAISVITPEDIPIGPPLAVSAAAISSTSIRISWQAPLLELQNGAITSYLINLLELETGVLRNFTTVPTDSIYVVNALHPYYNYNCSVAAYTVGLGPSDYYTVQTLQEEPSESPRNVSVTATNASTVIVSWLPPLPEHWNGIIQGYSVRVVGSDTGEDFTLTINSTTITVASLHPFYSYRFTVAAFTISDGPFNNPITVMMPPLAPSQAVLNVTAEPISPTSLTLRWLPPSQDEWNGIISRYTIEYTLLRPVQEDSDEEEEEEEEDTSDLLMTFVAYAPSSAQPLANNPDPRLASSSPLVWEEREITGLQEYYVYSVSIYYENSAGRSASSDSTEFNMPPDAPTGAPTDVRATAAPSGTIIMVRWMPPELFERNGPIVGYETALTYSNGTRRLYMSSGSTFNLQIEGLPKFATINVTVAARTTVGVGPSSPPVQVKTSIPGTPEAPGALEANIVDKTKVMLTWSPPNSDGVLLDFQIIYYGYKLEDTARVTKRQAVEVVILDGPEFITVPPDQTTYLIENLDIELNYTFVVRARTEAGFGANSTARTVDLSPGIAEPVPNAGSGSSVTAVIVLAVIGWIFAMVVIILVVAVVIWRRRHRYRALNLVSGSKNKRLRGPHAPVGVHNTNFYEVEGQTRINPAEGLELDDAAYENEGADFGDGPPDSSSRLVFTEEPPSDDTKPATLEAAAEAKRRAIEEEEDETKVAGKEMEYNDGGEIVFL